MSEQPLNSKNITGGTGITAGRDVSIGDVTGQLAIGEYIYQLKIEKPSGDELIKLVAYLEQKRQEKVNINILNSYTPSALPNYPPKLKEFVITNRVEEINKALIYLQHHRILLFTGIGGVGKTTLARALVDVRTADIPTPFWFNFRDNEDAKVGDVLEELAAYMNSPDIAKFSGEKREAEKKDIDKLTDKLNEGSPVWLIFDNLETILDDIYFQDQYLDLLFTSLRNRTHQAKIIITSRISPKLKNGEYLIDVIEGEKQDIKGLKTNFAVDYLFRNGLGELESDKLKELAIGVDGHPLALKLLIGLVKKFGVTDTLNDLSRYRALKENTIKKTKKLFEKLAGDEKELLERISVYRQAETMDAIKRMFTDKTPIDALGKLIDKSLLETDHKGSYWLHPLVQEFAYDNLENKKEVHKLVMEHYLSLPIPEKPAKKEDIQPLIEAHHHACMAEEYDLAFNIIFGDNLQEHLDLWGNYTVLIDIFSKMLPEDHFGNEILLENKRDHGAILKNTGNTYIHLGEPKKAIDYYEQALRISRDISDRRGESADLGNMGIAHRHLGEPKKAIGYYEQALRISRDINDRHGESADLGNMGNAYCDLGEPKKAIGYYEQALKIAQESGDRRGEGACLGNMGYAYCKLGEPKKAIEYCEQALRISRDVSDRREEGACLGNMGDAYCDLGEPKKAIEYCEQALKISKKLGDRREEGACLGNMGNAYCKLGEPRKAIEYYEKALKISKEMGYKHAEGEQLGYLGNAYCDLGEPRKAIEYYEKALKISKDVGDRHAEGEQLGYLGNAYCDLGEPRKAIEYYEQALKIAKEIEDSRIINFCERNLEALKDSKK